jgi:peptidoglycan/LPS O-acetylase OafA/YrhL
MDRRSRREIGVIFAIVGLIVGWAIPHFRFLTAAEDLILLAIIAILVLLTSSVLGRVFPPYGEQLPWGQIFGGTSLFVGALVVGYLVFGRSPLWVKEWVAVLIVLAVLGAIVYHNLPVRRSGGSS